MTTQDYQDAGLYRLQELARYNRYFDEQYDAREHLVPCNPMGSPFYDGIQWPGGYQDTVMSSNWQVITEQLDALCDPENKYYGDEYSETDTYDIVNGWICVPETSKRCIEYLIDVLQGLENYPLIDDEHHTNLEQELISEHWESYGARDFRDALRLDLDPVDNDELLQIYYGAAESSGFYPYVESDGGTYFDCESVAKNADASELFVYCEPYELATYCEKCDDTATALFEIDTAIDTAETTLATYVSVKPEYAEKAKRDTDDAVIALRNDALNIALAFALEQS